MKVRITSTKAPWPAGAEVGSVVELPFDAIPESLSGKCAPAEDGAEATHAYEPPPPPDPRNPGDLLVPLHTPPQGVDAKLLAEAQKAVDELTQRLQAAEAAAAAAVSERDAAMVRIASSGDVAAAAIAERDAALARVAELEAAAAAAGAKAKK